MPFIEFISVIVIGYLLGAIPFGLIVGKLMGDVDVTRHGSGKTGGANVLITVGTKAGALVIALDVGKAVAAVILAKVIVGSSVSMIGGIPLHWQIAQVMAALAVMVGHNWSVFLKFKGGRGVAAFFGTVLAMSPPVALFGVEVLAISALRSRYMSLGSILGAIAVWCLLIPLTIAYSFPPVYLLYGLVALILIVYQHRDNLVRIRQGTERRLGEKGERIS